MKVFRLFVLFFLVSSCIFFGTAYFLGEENNKGTGQEELVFYREQNAELQAELERLRTERYTAEAGFKKEIAELEAALVESRGEYLCEEIEGGVILVEYLGTEKSVEVPSEIDGRAVIAVGREAFRNTAVEYVVLPNGLLKIDWFAFSGCRALCEITVPKSVETIEYGAFDGCSTLTVICEKGTFAEKYATSYGIPMRNE